MNHSWRVAAILQLLTWTARSTAVDFPSGLIGRLTFDRASRSRVGEGGGGPNVAKCNTRSGILGAPAPWLLLCEATIIPTGDMMLYLVRVFGTVSRLRRLVVHIYQSHHLDGQGDPAFAFCERSVERYSNDDRTLNKLLTAIYQEV